MIKTLYFVMVIMSRLHRDCQWQWRIVGSRGPGARKSVGPSEMVRPNVYQLGGAGSPPAGSGPGQSPEGKRILATTY